jgi:hypothetical protein
LGTQNARFILQGRNEHTGSMVPDEKSLEYGKSKLKRPRVINKGVGMR